MQSTATRAFLMYKFALLCNLRTFPDLRTGRVLSDFWWVDALGTAGVDPTQPVFNLNPKPCFNFNLNLSKELLFRISCLFRGLSPK